MRQWDGLVSCMPQIRKEKYHQQLQADRNPAQGAVVTNRH